LVDMRLQEIVRDIEEQLRYLFIDYSAESGTVNWSDESNRSWESIKDGGPIVIARTLGYDVSSVHQLEEIEVVPRGFRLLIKKSKIPMSIAVKAINEFRNIHEIRCAGIETLKGVDGIGTKRAKAIVEKIEQLKRDADCSLQR